MFRRKMGLSPVAEPPGNRCQPFYVEMENYLKERWSNVVHLDDTYKSACRQDLFYAYYRADRQVMSEAGMEKLADLEHRFDAWRVTGRRGQ
jgi:hypothetical protein